MAEEEATVETTPLTPAEIAFLRDMVVREQRARWVYATLRVWAGWLSTSALFLYASYDFLIRALWKDRP